MPELPEVEVVRRGLAEAVVGDVFGNVDVRFPTLREPIPDVELRRVLPGRELRAVRRRAKYLLLDLDGDWSVVVHLGMSGRFTLQEPSAPELAHTHVLLQMVSGRELRFVDPRRFGLFLLLRTDQIDRDVHFRHLGVEPLTGSLRGDHLQSWARGRRVAVKSLLLDARCVVGVGNIYAAESLFLCGIHPLRSVSRIGGERYQLLAEAIVTVLSDAVKQGGTTINDYRNAKGEPGLFSVELQVYGREGEPCYRCGRPIRRIVQANRSTFYCPGCQR